MIWLKGGDMIRAIVQKRNARTGERMLFLMLLVGLVLLWPSAGWAGEPVLVATSGLDNDLINERQIVRTSSGRIYFFFGNGDGWIQVHTSEDGFDWTHASTHDEYSGQTAIGITMDSKNVAHIMAYDRDGRPYYERFNTADSPKGDHSWEGHELLSRQITDGGAAIVVDCNDIPHVVYRLFEKYHGISYYTLYYANRIGGVWRSQAIWPKEHSINAPWNFSLIIGPDNVPYILMGAKVLKGNNNNPSAFEEQDLGIKGYSFVIHQNGDVRVALSFNGNYAHYVHDHLQGWNDGWVLYDSGRPDEGGILTLENDVPYRVALSESSIWIQKEFDAPVLVASQAPGHLWRSLTTGWSLCGDRDGVIDIGLTSRVEGRGHYYLFTGYRVTSRASFAASSRTGLSPFTVNFTDSSVAAEGTSIVSWAWDFDNDGVVDSVLQNPAATYAAVGKYSVSLSVEDSSGERDTLIEPDYIEVAKDTDDDGIFDADDNCPFDYNAAQVDLDADGIGDACDELVDLIKGVSYSTGLRKETSPDTNTSDVTGLMKDGLFEAGKRIQYAKNKYNILSFKTTFDAKEISSYILKVYVSGSAVIPQEVHVYAYEGNGLSPQLSVLTFTLTSEWNELDLTPLLHLMDGFGFTKFRIVAPRDWLDISEAWVTAKSNKKADEWEISVNPTSLDFGAVEVGGYSGTNITVSNTGTGELRIGAISGLSQPFQLKADGCSHRNLAGAATCSVIIVFRPLSEGSFQGSLKIPSDDRDNPAVNVSLSGIALPYATLSGTVRDAVTGLPIPNVNIRVSQPRHLQLSPEDYVYSWECLPLFSSHDSDDDLETFYTQSDYELVKDNDEEKLVMPTCPYINSQDYHNVMQFRVRNPLNSVDQFRVIWNGMIGDSLWYADKLAQSFTPGENGPLTKVSLNLYRPEFNISGYLKVYVKSALGGEQDAVLAESNAVSFSAVPTAAYTWMDFTFPSPTELVAGKTYYLELQGDGCLTGYDIMPPRIFWGYEENSQYSGGQSFSQMSTVWHLLNTGTFSFKTFVNEQADQQQNLSCCNKIISFHCGLPTFSLYIFNRSVGQWEFLASKRHTLGYDDDSLEWVIGDTPTGDYYDPEGWISLKVSQDFLYKDIATDLFSLEFEKILSAQTDSQGNFTVTELLPGNYEVLFERQGYWKETMDGALVAGETRAINVQLTPYPPLVLNITSPQDGAILRSSPTTVTGTVSNNASVTVNGSSVSVINGVFSQSIVLQEGLNTITVVANDQYGQEMSKNITLTAILPKPAVICDIAVTDITSDSATVTWRTDQATYGAVVYGQSGGGSGEAADWVLTTTHATTLSYLSAGTNYHFRVDAMTADGLWTHSEEINFATRVLTETVGDYGNVTVMEVSGRYDAVNPDGTINDLSRREVAKEFLRLHTDQYDFLVIFSNFDYPMPMAEAAAFYLGIKNDVQGIGKSIFDSSASFGSAGKLQGIIEMGNIFGIASDPGEAGFEDTLALLSHEQMHRWGANVRFKDAGGTMSAALLGQDGNHWTFLLDSDASVLYGSDWRENENGTFTSLNKQKNYSSLDLYLMGLYDKAEVPPMLLIDNPNIDPARQPEVGVTISGTPRIITIDDVVAAEGERVPDASASQKTFRTAFILLTRPGTFTENGLNGIENIRSGWAGRLSSLTGGRAAIIGVAPSLTVSVSSPLNGETLFRPDVTVKGAIINTTGNDTAVTVNGITAIVYGNQFIAGHVPLTEGPNTITVIASDAAGNSAAKSVLVDAVTTEDYIRITSDKNSGTSPLEVTLKIDGSFPTEDSTVGVMGPAPVELIDNPAPDEYKIRMVAEGIYHFTAEVLGPDGNSYQDAVDVIVSNKPLRISDVSVTNIGPDTATINWITDRQMDGLVEYGETTTFGNTILSADFTTNHSVIVSGLTPDTTYHFRVVSKNAYGMTWSSEDYIFTTFPLSHTIALRITSPSNGETINRADVSVKGTVANAEGNETGVTVNGIVATVYDNQFIVNHVPLTEGANTIAVTATDTAENTAVASITVNAVAPENYVRLVGNIESGIAPLEVSLRIDGSFSIENSSLSHTGTDIEIIDNPGPDEYLIRLTVEGIYYVTVNVTGPDGNTYEDTIAITVLNREQLDALLKAKWEGMKEALSNGDVNGAVSYIGVQTKQHYAELFTALQSHLPEVVQALREIELIRGVGKSATYNMNRSELYGGQIVGIDYSVYFVVDGDGVWKIDWF